VSALVIDTSAWVSYLAGRSAAEPLIEAALDEGLVHLPPVVAAELLSGRLTARQRRELVRLLDDLPMVNADRAHWYRVGEVRAALRARGLAVSTPDAHVARCALDLDAGLVTEDGIFALVAPHLGLRLVGPLER
jgi:predicted nucleic acid-binding protein